MITRGLNDVSVTIEFTAGPDKSTRQAKRSLLEPVLMHLKQKFDATFPATRSHSGGRSRGPRCVSFRTRRDDIVVGPCCSSSSIEPSADNLFRYEVSQIYLGKPSCAAMYSHN